MSYRFIRVRLTIAVVEQGSYRLINIFLAFAVLVCKASRLYVCVFDTNHCWTSELQIDTCLLTLANLAGELYIDNCMVN